MWLILPKGLKKNEKFYTYVKVVVGSIDEVVLIILVVVVVGIISVVEVVISDILVVVGMEVEVSTEVLVLPISDEDVVGSRVVGTIVLDVVLISLDVLLVVVSATVVVKVLSSDVVVVGVSLDVVVLMSAVVLSVDDIYTCIRKERNEKVKEKRKREKREIKKYFLHRSDFINIFSFF
jgi:hypothetical protein